MEDSTAFQICGTKCIGCGNCAEICSLKACEMQPDSEGFCVPVTDKSKCVDCGECKEVCPVISRHTFEKNSEIFLADYGKNDLSEIFAQILLEGEGYVCRVCGDSDGNAAYRILKYPEETGKALIDVPYVKAEISNVSEFLIKILDGGEKVIFEGQPCDAAAIMSFLKKDYNNLFIVDSICQGGVSEKVYKKYINDSFGNNKATSFLFDKDELSVCFDDGTNYKCPISNSPYFKAYSKQMIYRKSCYSCKFRGADRLSDFTTGISEKSVGKHILISNSEKSKKYIEKLLEKSTEYRKITFAEARKENSLLDPMRYKIPDERHRFFEEFDEKDFSYLVNDILCRKYNVGISGIWFGLNYGSVLTYYALYRTIRKLGYTAVLLAKPKYMWNERYSSRNSISGEFIYNHCNVGSVVNTPEDMYLLNDNCDMFIAGSDVIWNYQICGNETGGYFFLDFVSDSKKKIVYSASFGSGLNCPESRLSKIRKSVNRLDYVSVREDEAVEICRENFDINPVCTIDPVFLCDTSEYESLAKESGICSESPFMAAYILGADKLKKKFILKAEEILQIPAKCIVNPNDAKGAMEVLQLPDMISPSVEEWLYYIKNSEFVVCDSFYGVCFSIIFRKNFIAVINKELDSKCRFEMLLKKCGLLKRLIYIEDGIEKHSNLFETPIDYNEVYEKLDKYKSESYDWLKNALIADKPTKTGTLFKEIEELEYRLGILEEKIYR